MASGRLGRPGGRSRHDRPCANLPQPGTYPGRLRARGRAGPRQHPQSRNTPNVVGAGSLGRPQGTPEVLASGRCWASPPPLTETSLSLQVPPPDPQSVRRLPRGSGRARLPQPNPLQCAPRRGQIRCEPPLPPPPCLLLPHGVPPTEARLVFPGSGLGRGWPKSCRLRGFRRAPSLARHKDGNRPVLP